MNINVLRFEFISRLAGVLQKERNHEQKRRLTMNENESTEKINDKENHSRLQDLILLAGSSADIGLVKDPRGV